MKRKNDLAAAIDKHVERMNALYPTPQGRTVFRLIPVRGLAKETGWPYRMRKDDEEDGESQIRQSPK